MPSRKSAEPDSGTCCAVSINVGISYCQNSATRVRIPERPTDAPDGAALPKNHENPARERVASQSQTSCRASPGYGRDPTRTQSLTASSSNRLPTTQGIQPHRRDRTVSPRRPRHGARNARTRVGVVAQRDGRPHRVRERGAACRMQCRPERVDHVARAGRRGPVRGIADDVEFLRVRQLRRIAPFELRLRVRHRVIRIRGAVQQLAQHQAEQRARHLRARVAMGRQRLGVRVGHELFVRAGVPDRQRCDAHQRAVAILALAPAACFMRGHAAFEPFDGSARLNPHVEDVATAAPLHAI